MAISLVKMVRGLVGVPFPVTVYDEDEVALGPEDVTWTGLDGETWTIEPGETQTVFTASEAGTYIATATAGIGAQNIRFIIREQVLEFSSP